MTAVNPHIGYESPVSELLKGLVTEEEIEYILAPYEMTHPGISGSKLLAINDTIASKI